MKTVLALITILIFPTIGYSHLNPPQYITLTPLDNNLEFENLIETLCPKNSPNFEQCKKDKLHPQTWTLSAYEKPAADSKLLGKILITGVPGKGLTAQYQPTGKALMPLLPDSKGDDWGYSSYFEFTVSEVSGDWIQLPKRPFENPVWINLKKEWSKKNAMAELPPSAQTVNTETVYSAGALGDIVFTKFSKKEFSYRKENDNDMLCGDEPKKIPAAELKEFTKPIETLFDKDGHLMAWLKYSRGC